MYLSITKKQIGRGVSVLLLFCLCFFGGNALGRAKSVLAVAESKPRLAVIIDDFGYHGEGTEEMLSLSVPLTVAMMPFSACTVSDCKLVKEAGKQVIVHLPMESLTGDPAWVGAKGIFRRMDDASIRQRVKEALTLVPDAVGINNHMGSAIMEDKRSLSAVMDVVKEEGLFFVDSMTTPNSVAETVCKEKEVPLLKRKVFLDSTDDLETVKKKLRQAGEIAKKEGSAIAIGHVGPEGGIITVKALETLGPELEAEGVQFVFVSELLQ